MGNRKSRQISILISLFVILILAAVFFFPDTTGPRLRYYAVSDLFRDTRVSAFSLDFGTGELEMMVNDDNGQPVIVNYVVPNILIFREDIEPYVTAYNEAHPDDRMQVDYLPAAETPWWASLIPSIVLIGIMIAFWIYMVNQASSGGAGKMSSFGKARIKPHVDQGKRTTFADVAGADEEKEELEEIVEFLKNPKKFNEIGARIPKGVLLVGPPGTGKTLLARAVAGEAGVPFFSISGSDFVEMFVGVGASRVRDLFEQAKKDAPSIIFIDEIDAVGRHRGAGLGGGHDEREQTLNQLLVEMDGFGANTGVIVIAATNRRDILDPALLRPGRFDRQVVVNYPDIKGREEILKVHTRQKPLGPDVDLSVIAKTTAGFTGADLENLVNEAALLAAKRGRKAITMDEIEEATIKVVAGPEKRSKVVTEKEKKLTSVHEAGHAICTFYSKTQSPVHQISIIPRGMAGGYTLSLPEEDRNYVVKTEMMEELVVLLGGRVAEKLVLDDISTGASNDIQRATKLARNMITRYGFSEKLGPIVYGTGQEEIFLGRDLSTSRDYSEMVAAEIDSEMRRLIEDAYKATEAILAEHMDQLMQVAKYLFVHEKMDAEEFDKMMHGELAAPDVDLDSVGTLVRNGPRERYKPFMPQQPVKPSATGGNGDPGPAAPDAVPAEDAAPSDPAPEVTPASEADLLPEDPAEPEQKL